MNYIIKNLILFIFLVFFIILLTYFLPGIILLFPIIMIGILIAGVFMEIKFHDKRIIIVSVISFVTMLILLVLGFTSVIGL